MKNWQGTKWYTEITSNSGEGVVREYPVACEQWQQQEVGEGKQDDMATREQDKMAKQGDWEQYHQNIRMSEIESDTKVRQSGQVGKQNRGTGSQQQDIGQGKTQWQDMASWHGRKGMMQDGERWQEWQEHNLQHC
jgi:hypothetical protein